MTDTHEALRLRVLRICGGHVGIAAAILLWVEKVDGPARELRLAALDSCAALSLRRDGSAACLIEAAEAAEKFLGKPARGTTPGPAAKRALHGQQPTGDQSHDVVKA